MFEKLKQKLLDRIERDAVKSEFTYKPSKRSDITITEVVYLKRSKLPLIGDWARIYPPLNEDGSPNWANIFFGGRKNLIKLIFVGSIIAMTLLGFYEIFSYIEAIKPYCLIPTS